MHRRRVPEALWNFGARYTTRVRRILPQSRLGDRSAHEVLTGETGDISELTDFDFYEFVKFRELDPAFPEQRMELGRWLGPTDDVGQPMCSWILKENCQVVARSTVRPLTEEEERDPEEQKKMKEFDVAVTEKLGKFDEELVYDFGLDELENAGSTEEDKDEGVIRESPEQLPDSGVGHDPVINAEVILPRGDAHERGTVIGRKRDSDGNLVGRKHRIPTLDSRVYTVRWADGDEEDFTYNQIAEHIFTQVDEEGNQYQIFREIVNHRKTKRAVDKADQYRDVGGRRYKKKTTAGWELEVEWKDGSTSWVTLKNLKETNTVAVAEYAVANRIDAEPAFDWWVHSVLKKRKRLINAQKSLHRRVGYKYGVKLPRTVEEALKIDEESGTTFWRDALDKEMKNVEVAFDIKEPGAKPPPGHKRITLHMVFDVKMDFTRKCRLVAGGHLTDPPETMTYSSVVSRESVRIAFTIAALMDLEVQMTDIGNAYLNAPTSEKVYSVAGKEFGPNEGRLVVIVRALYGLKSAGASWRKEMASTLRDLRFKSCLADPDVWLRPAEKSDGEEYYEYVLVYVDDILVVSHDPSQVIR